jgi:hypothetical protein
MLFDEMQYGFEIVLWEWFAVFWVFIYPPWLLWERPSWSEWIQDRTEGPSRRIQYCRTKPFVSLVKISRQEADEKRNRLYPEVSLPVHVFDGLPEFLSLTKCRTLLGETRLPLG